MKHLFVTLLFAAATSLHAQDASPAASPAAIPAAIPVATPGTDATPTVSATAAATTGTEVARAETPPARQELVTRLQIFLDQQNFGPGIIDGRWGEFTGKALVHYAKAHSLQVTPDIYHQLPLDSVYPIYADYTIAAEDLKTVGELPTQARQSRPR